MPGVALLVDAAIWPWRGERWAHLVSDVSYDELHAFAHDHGVPDAAFDVDHYDVPERMYDALVAGGALPVRATELIRRLIAGGVRVRAVERRS